MKHLVNTIIGACLTLPLCRNVIFSLQIKVPARISLQCHVNHVNIQYCQRSIVDSSALNSPVIVWRCSYPIRLVPLLRCTTDSLQIVYPIPQDVLGEIKSSKGFYALLFNYTAEPVKVHFNSISFVISYLKIVMAYGAIGYNVMGLFFRIMPIEI